MKRPRVHGCSFEAEKPESVIQLFRSLASMALKEVNWESKDSAVNHVTENEKTIHNENK